MTIEKISNFAQGLNQNLRPNQNRFEPKYKPQSNDQTYKRLFSNGWPRRNISIRHAWEPVSEEFCLLNNKYQNRFKQKSKYI